ARVAGAIVRGRVGREMGVARRGGAAGGQPGDGPQGHQPGIDLGPLAPDQQHHPRELRVLLAAAATGIRSGQGDGTAGGSGTSQRLRRRRILLRRVLFECRRGAPEQFCRSWHQQPAAAARARRVLQGVCREEFEKHHLRRQWCVRQYGDPDGSVLRQGWHLRLWQLPRRRRAVPATGGRARPQKTRSSPREDAAARYDRSIYAPIWLLGFLNGVGPRVGESGFELIPGFAYTAPYEDITLKGA